MADKRFIAQQKKLDRLHSNPRTKERRDELKHIISSENSTQEEVDAAVRKLSQLPKSHSRVRYQRRCRHCGRPHGVYRFFGLCRCCLRKFAQNGWIPGLRKSSW